MTDTCKPTDIPPIEEIDVAATLEKYAHERERRLRPEGQGQYLEPRGAFADICDDDPHMPVTPRDPIDEDLDVAVLGGGFGGVLASYQLQKAGVTTFRNIDHAGDFGGCWYWNRYPGVECDNVSYVYFPLLEEMGYMPGKKFSPGYEIRDYIQSIARKYGLYDKALFHTRVSALRWDEAISRWRLTTNRGDEIRARFVVMGVGPLNKPKLPSIPGLEIYQGKIFHSSRWDYDYTGGSQESPQLDKLADQRIAVVGTGASAVQIVPYLGRYAKHLYVIQRTPSSVDVRDNTDTDPEWARSLEPGWHQRLLRNFQHGLWEGLARDEPDLICDIWTEISRNIRHEREQAGWPDLPVEYLLQLRNEHDHRTMERLRRRVEDIVEDKDTAERLKPYYRFLCKRPCSNDFYYPTFNRPNVDLLDVSTTRGIEALTEKGFIHEGREYQADCIILASGYEQTSELKKRWAFDALEGYEGQSIYNYWENGYQTLHGMASHGFPNQFYIGFIQGAVHASTTETWNRQAEHIAYLISEALDRGATRMEPTESAQEAWVNHLHDTEIDVESFQRQCTPGYYNNEGGKQFRYFLGEAYGPGPYAFWGMLEAWRAEGKLRGFTLR